MTAKEASEILTEHNKWRRGGNGPMQEPAMVGQAIDIIVGGLIEPDGGEAKETELCRACFGSGRFGLNHCSECSYCQGSGRQDVEPYSPTIADLQHEITRLENEIDRLTEANLDMAREIGAKSEPVEYGC